MKYLAVDLAKVGVIGLAAFDGADLLWSGLARGSKKGWSIKRTGQDPKAKPFYYPESFDMWTSISIEDGIHDIVIEDTFVGKSGAVAMKLAEARGFLKGQFHREFMTFHMIRIDEWHSTILTAHPEVSAWPRERTAGKALSVKLVMLRHLFEPMDDNEADAINIGDAFRMQGGTM